MSSGNNIFQEVLTDAQGVSEKLLGPSYPYYKNIKLPSDIGMSDKGSLSALGKDIDGLIAYVEVLVAGKSKASVPGGPLGNKFFLQTAAKCIDNQTNQQVDRYIYVDNVPDGNIPFISGGLGVNFSDLKGLIPGAMGNLNVLNPFGILRSFLSGTTPPCQELTMETIDVNNNKSTESHYVTVADIQSMDPCMFSNGQNPVSNKKCNETFSSFGGVTVNAEEIKLPKDVLAQVYFFSLAGIGIYIMYRLMDKDF
jgi:hypothetical protein